jgi:hypothetical protein
VAGQKNYKLIWDDFMFAQCQYNSFYDEWDLCEAFAPGDIGTHDEEWDLDDQNDDLPLLPDDQVNYPSSHEYTSHSDLQQIYNISDTYDDPVIEVNVKASIDDMAYYCFGFVNPIGTPDKPSFEVKWEKVQKWLSTKWSMCPDSNNAIHTFFGHLKSALMPNDIPEDLYDIWQTNACVCLQWNIKVHLKIFHDKQYYVVTPHTTSNSNGVEFELFFTSAASVLEVVQCQWGPDLYTIICGLMSRGIPFNTCMHGLGLVQLPLKLELHYGGLGYQPKKYTPDLIDYQAYECLHNHFLLSPHGRAAILAGSIVIHLARESVGFERVCTGSSDSGICFWDGNQSSIAYWDDQLTEDEVDLICGVYRVDTGQ